MTRGRDLGMAAQSGLVVTGVVFNAFALVAVSFGSDGDLGFILGSFGTASWLAAAVLWYFFLVDPEPRHGKRR